MEMEIDSLQLQAALARAARLGPSQDLGAEEQKLDQMLANLAEEGRYGPGMRRRVFLVRKDMTVVETLALVKREFPDSQCARQIVEMITPTDNEPWMQDIRPFDPKRRTY